MCKCVTLLEDTQNIRVEMPLIIGTCFTSSFVFYETCIFEENSF